MEDTKYHAPETLDEALDLLAIAERADPLSSLLKQGIGFNLAWRGDHQASLPYLEAAIEMNPNDFFAIWMLALVYIELDRLRDAEITIERLEGHFGTEAFSKWAWSALHIARQDEASAQRVLEEMVALHSDGSDDPLLAPAIGIVYTYLGQIEEAVIWFERGSETPSPFNSLSATFFYNNPALWNNSRFQKLMKKMNLDGASIAESKSAIGKVSSI